MTTASWGDFPKQWSGYFNGTDKPASVGVRWRNFLLSKFCSTLSGSDHAEEGYRQTYLLEADEAQVKADTMARKFAAYDSKHPAPFQQLILDLQDQKKALGPTLQDLKSDAFDELVRHFSKDNDINPYSAKVQPAVDRLAKADALVMKRMGELKAAEDKLGEKFENIHLQQNLQDIASDVQIAKDNLIHAKKEQSLAFSEKNTISLADLNVTSSVKDYLYARAHCEMKHQPAPFYVSKDTTYANSYLNRLKGGEKPLPPPTVTSAIGLNFINPVRWLDAMVGGTCDLLARGICAAGNGMFGNNTTGAKIFNGLLTIFPVPLIPIAAAMSAISKFLSVAGLKAIGSGIANAFSSTERTPVSEFNDVKHEGLQRGRSMSNLHSTAQSRYRLSHAQTHSKLPGVESSKKSTPSVASAPSVPSVPSVPSTPSIPQVAVAVAAASATVETPPHAEHKVKIAFTERLPHHPRAAQNPQRHTAPLPTVSEKKGGGAAAHSAHDNEVSQIHLDETGGTPPRGINRPR